MDPSSIAKEELAGKLAGGVTDFNISKSMGVDVGVDLSYKPSEGEGWGYKLNVKGTLDLNVPDNTAFSVSLTDTVSSAQKFAITYLGKEDVIYVQVGENKYKLENSDILAALGIEAGDVNVTMGTYLSMVLTALGDNCTVSEDGNTYTMDFNLKNTLNSTLGDIIGGVLNGLDQDLVNTIYSLFGASDWSSFVAKLPDISGKMEIKFADGKLTAVALKDVSYTNGDSKGTIQANVSPFSISNTKVEVQAPADKDSYVATKMLNLAANGKIDVKTAEGVITRLSWDVKMNLDLIAIIESGGNLSDEALKDNFLHLSLYIDPADQEINTDFLASRNAYEQTNILDVVYDPTNTGTGYLYVAANLDNIISKSVASAISGMSVGLSDSIIHKSVLLPIDLAAVLGLNTTGGGEGSGSGEGEGSGSGESSGSSINIAEILNTVLDIAGFKDNAITIDYNNLMSMLEAELGTAPVIGSLTLRDIVTSILGGDDKTITELAFTASNFEYAPAGNENYNALNAGLINNSYGVEEPEKKVYNENMGTPVLEAHVSTSKVMIEEEEYNFIDLFPGTKQATGEPNYIYDADAADSTKYISAEELLGAANYNVQYTYTDIYGDEQSAGEGIAYQTRIVNIQGFDPESTEPQLVTFNLVPMDGNGVLTQLNNLLAAIGLDLKFAANQVQGYVQVNAKLESTTAQSEGGGGMNKDHANTTDDEVIYLPDGATLLTYGSMAGTLHKNLILTIKYEGIEEAKMSKTTFEEGDYSFADESKIEKTMDKPLFGGDEYPVYTAKGIGKNSLTITTGMGTFVWNYEIIGEDQVTTFVPENTTLKIGDNVKLVTGKFVATTESGEQIDVAIKSVSASSNSFQLSKAVVAGAAQVTVTDEFGYKHTVDVTITPADSVEVKLPTQVSDQDKLTDVIKHIATVGENKIELTVRTADYTVWKDGEDVTKTAIKSNKFTAAGTYTIKFTDCNGKVYEQEVTVVFPTKFEIELGTSATVTVGTTLGNWDNNIKIVASYEESLALEAVKTSVSYSDIKGFFTDKTCETKAEITYSKTGVFTSSTKFQGTPGTYYVKIVKTVAGESREFVVAFELQAAAEEA